MFNNLHVQKWGVEKICIVHASYIFIIHCTKVVHVYYGEIEVAPDSRKESQLSMSATWSLLNLDKG